MMIKLCGLLCRLSGNQNKTANAFMRMLIRPIVIYKVKLSNDQEMVIQKDIPPPKAEVRKN